MAAAHEVLGRLREGNTRFVSGSNQKAEWRAVLPEGQAPLAIVLGHSQCGAVLETIEELKNPSKNPSPDLLAIGDRVRPAVEDLVATELGHDAPNLVEEAVKANIRASVNHLRYGSAILEERGREHGLFIIGAEYSLETGEVEFLDEIPL